MIHIHIYKHNAGEKTTKIWFVCLLKWLQVIIHVYVVTYSSCTDIYSSLISKVDPIPLWCVPYGMCWVTCCWYHNICTPVVAYCFAACFKEILVSTPWRWQDNATKCRSYV